MAFTWLKSKSSHTTKYSQPFELVLFLVIIVWTKCHKGSITAFILNNYLFNYLIFSGLTPHKVDVGVILSIELWNLNGRWLSSWRWIVPCSSTIVVPPPSSITTRGAFRCWPFSSPFIFLKLKPMGMLLKHDFTLSPICP